jgi:hypothetical protein
MEENDYMLPLGLGESSNIFEFNPPSDDQEKAQDAADFFALKIARDYGTEEVLFYPMDTSEWEQGSWRKGWDILILPEVSRMVLRKDAMDLQEKIYFAHGILVPFKIGVMDVE